MTWYFIETITISQWHHDCPHAYFAHSSKKVMNNWIDFLSSQHAIAQTTTDLMALRTLWEYDEEKRIKKNSWKSFQQKCKCIKYRLRNGESTKINKGPLMNVVQFFSHSNRLSFSQSHRPRAIGKHAERL